MRTIAFFNNKGGVGKTSLVYHLAWMYAELGCSVVAADLDPQSNLTSMFLDDEELEPLWAEDGNHATVYGAFKPLIEGTGDINAPKVQDITPHLGLVAGDLLLSGTEGELSSRWPGCLDGDPRAFRVITALWRILERASEQRNAGLVLIDMGPNLGALNRAALVAAEWVVLPLMPDLYSLQGLKNLGPTLKNWKEGWDKRRQESPQDLSIPMPAGNMAPIGYIVMQHAIRLDRPVQAYGRWMERIPEVYAESVLNQGADDSHCLATLKHYRSLMPFAQEARKPMFLLTPADGAFGGHSRRVRDCYEDFERLARRLAQCCNLPLS